MTRLSLIGFSLLVALAIYAAPGRAASVPENFEDPAYVPGDPLSDVWADGDDTTGVLTIDDVGPDHNKTVRLDASGPDPGPAFPNVNGTYDGWGGPGRNAGALWFRTDIEMGTPLNGTPLSTNIYNVTFFRASGASIIQLYGGLGTVGMKASNSTFATGTVSLAAGWNSVVVMNDTSQTPNTRLFLNGIQVLTLNVTSGAGQSSTSAANKVTISRLTRGGTGDAFEGSMRFDNIITANTYEEIPEPSTVILLGLGVIPAAMLIRRRRKSA